MLIYGYEIAHQSRGKKKKQDIVFSENLKNYIVYASSLFINKCYDFINTPKISKQVSIKTLRLLMNDVLQGAIEMSQERLTTIESQKRIASVMMAIACNECG